MLESLFNKVAGFDACDVIKETPTQVFSCKICDIVKNTFFYRAPPEAASGKRQNIIIYCLYNFHRAYSRK